MSANHPNYATKTDAHKALYTANPSGWTTVSNAFLEILHRRITGLMSLKPNRLNM